MSFYTNVKAVGSQIFLRGVDDIGERFQKKVRYSPTLFVPVKEETKYKTLEGINTKPIKPGDLRETREFMDRYKDVSNYKIFGNDNFAFAFIGDEYPDEIEYDINKLVIANIDIEVASDEGFPHAESAASPVISIAVKFNDSFYVFGFGEPEGCKIEETLKERGILYVSCDDERDLLDSFLHTWNEYSPDIVTGWNVSGFDIPYLYNRLCRLHDEKTARRLSPWKYASIRKFQSGFGQDQMNVDLSGIATLDYLDLYKKFTYTNQESYRLDYIANVELGESKLSYSEFGSLHTLYKRDYHKFIEYNVKDVELVERLENKMKLIEMAVALAYSAKVNLGDVFSQVRMWDSICYHHLRKKDIVLPPRKSADKNVQFEGAYVKEPQVGAHNWVVSFDLNSLYPHLMMQYNLSPEKLIPEDKANKDLVDSLKRGPWDTISSYDKLIDKEFDTSLLKRDNLTVTPNIMFFKRDSQGFLPEILEDLYNKRKSSKKKMLECQQLAEGATGEEKQKYLNLISKHNNDQLARKVQLNSAYGALGNQYFRFYDLRIAEAVTKAGQLSIRWIESKMNKYLNTLLETKDEDFVVASDTDSIYLTLDAVVRVVFGERVDEVETEKVVDFLDKVCSQKLEPYIDKCYDELADYMNAYAQKMVMKREAIASKGLWTAKKRYVLSVYNNEGVSYSKPKLKVMGLEAVKSSTPEVCRQKIKDALTIIMSGSESDAQAFIKEFKQEFYSLPAEDVAFPRGVNGVGKYTDGDTYIKHTPIHVKGSIIYNRLIRENKLDKQYPRIMDGDKIKFLYLNMPNPSREAVISITNNLPEEFGLNNFIDYDKQFVKAFLDPIKVLLDCVGWKPEPTNSLERFFG